jgi:Flp pilus assembly protein TadB
MKQEDEEIKTALAQSAEKIDGVEVATPDFMFFKDMVKKQQAAARRAQKRQLALFVVVAAFLLSVLIFLTGMSEVFFIALQAAAFAGAVFGLVVFFTRARRLKEGTR